MIKLQKRAARIILDKDIDTSSEEMFAELHWMKFPELIIKTLLLCIRYSISLLCMRYSIVSQGLFHSNIQNSS